MRVTVLPASELSDDLSRKWCSLQAANPGLRGPCLRPELPVAVGRLQPTVWVAVIEEQHGVTGFLPFAREGLWGVAKPVPMCDYQAVIGRAEQGWDVPRILRSAGLRAWEFDHLVAAADHRGAASSEAERAPRVDLSAGFDAYVADLGREDKSLRKALTQRRLIQRDIGPLRFDPLCRDPSVLAAILAWKAERFNDGCPLAPWVAGVLERLAAEQGPDFCGTLSAFYAGDTLVAAHFGLRCHGILHYWFPAFDPAYGKYSPGWVLLHELITHLPSLGCNILDFGPGGESYKWYFRNAELPIARGCFEVASLLSLVRRCRRQVVGSIRAMPRVRRGLRPFVRAFRWLAAR